MAAIPARSHDEDPGDEDPDDHDGDDDDADPRSPTERRPLMATLPVRRLPSPADGGADAAGQRR
jgi:hypothetical protein